MVDFYKPGDFRLLYQTDIWVDRHSDKHSLETMNIHHRAGLIGFLRKRAYYYQSAAWGEYLRGLGSVNDPSDGVLSAQLDAEAELLLPSDEWMERQPLFRRLVELDQRTPVQKRVTKLRAKAYPLRKRLGLAK
jgi:hypothetical protein